MMGLLKWFDGKVDAKTMDACDKELALSRRALGSQADRAERFVDGFLQAKGYVAQLITTRETQTISYASAITRDITEMYGGQRTGYAGDLLRRALEAHKQDFIYSSAYKMLATWHSLVEIRITSKADSYRAHNLILAYEEELSRRIELTVPRTREGVPFA